MAILVAADLNLQGNNVLNVATPTTGGGATPKSYVDGQITGLSGTYVAKAGDSMSGLLTLNAGLTVSSAAGVSIASVATLTNDLQVGGVSYAKGRLRSGFNSGVTVTTPLTTSAAEFELSSQSMVTIGEDTAGSANPHLTLYRTGSGLRGGGALRQFLTGSNGPFKWQWGNTGAGVYGSETYADLMTLDNSGDLTTAGWANVAQLRTGGTQRLDGAGALSNITTINTSGNVSVGGTLGVTGATTLAGMSATTGSFSSTLGVTGTSTLGVVNAGATSVTTLGTSALATLNSASVTTTLGVTGTSTLGVLNAGATGVTTLNSSGLATLNSVSVTTTLGVTGTSTLGVVNTGALTSTGLTVNGSGSITGTLGVTGNINMGSVLTFSNPGIGNDTKFIFTKTSDSAGITVNEVTNDTTWYAFTMADNPDGGDEFTMQWADWQTGGSGWTPFAYTGFIATHTANNHYYSGSHNFQGGPFLTAKGNSSWGNRDWTRASGGAAAVPLLSGTGTLTLAVNTNSYSGGMTVYWVILDTATTFKWGTGATTNTPTATGVLITGAAQTLNNGMTITFSSTTGGVTGDTYAWRMFPAGTMTVGLPASFSSTLGVTGTSTLGTVNAGATSVTTLGTSALATLNSASVTTTLGVTGATTLASMTATTGNFSSTLGVTGTSTLGVVNAGATSVTTLGTSALATLNSASVTTTLGVTGTSTLGVLNAGATSVTTLGTSSTATLNSASVTTTLGVTGTSTLGVVNAGATSVTTLGTSALATLNSASVTTTLGVTGTSTLGVLNAGATSVTSLGTSALATLNSASVTTTLGVTGLATLTGGASIGASSYGSADNTFFSWDANTNQIGFSKKATFPGKLAYATNSFIITEYVGQTTISPANTQTDRLTIAAGGAVTINQSLSVGTTLNVTGAVTLTTRLTGGNIALDTITGGAASSAGNIAAQTIQDYNVKDASISYSKLTGTAQSQILAFSTQDTNSQFMREVSSTGSSLDANNKETDGLTIANSATRVADTLAYRGQAISNAGMTTTAVTAAAGPAYAGLVPGQYQATVFLRKVSGTGTGNILTLQATGTAVTGSVITVTDTMLSGNYQGIVVPFTITAATNAVSITVTNSILPASFTWNYSHVKAVPATGQITQATVQTYFANAAITSAQIQTILASQIATGTLTAQSIYLGTSGHVYGGVTAAPTASDSYIDLNSTGMQGVVSGTTVMSLTSSGLTVTGGTIGGYTVTSTKLSAGSGATTIALDTANGISLGAATFAASPFRVSLAGALTATNASITGVVTATQGSFYGPVSGTTLNGLYSSTLNLVDTNPGPVSTSYWSDVSNTGAATVTQVTGTGSAAGGNAIQFAYTAVARTYSLPFLNIARAAGKLKTGATYTLSWYARSISGDLAMGSVALCDTSATNVVYAGTGSYTLSATWTRYTATFVAQLDSLVSTGFYWPRTNISTASTFQIAGVQIELGSNASAYVDGLQHVQIDSTGLKAFDANYNQVTSISSTTGVLTATGASISGSITATTGTIGGFTVGSTTLTAGSGAAAVGLDTANGIYLGNTVFGSAPFRVTLAGALTATNATITGAITATSGSFTGSLTSTSGTIGGFTLSATTLNAGGTTASSITLDTANGIYLGGTSAAAPFRVTLAGALTATNATITGAITATSGSFTGSITSTSGTIGGFTLSSTTLNVGGTTASSVTLDSANGIYLGGTSAAAPFRVSMAGALTATNATITGAITATSGSFTGSITSTSGTIGGFTLSSTTLNVGGTTASSITLDTANGIYLGGTSVAAPFRVTLAGVLTATSGTVGGFTLSSTTLNVGGTTASSITLDSANGIYMGGTSGAAPFRVSLAGALTATNATITGAITATSGSFTGTLTSSAGTIGGFTLSSTTLNAGGTGASSISLDTANGIYMGGTSAAAPFRVTLAGALTATNATITGAITATSGSFTGSLTSSSGTIGGFTLSATTLNAGGTGASSISLDTANGIYLGGTSTAAPFRVSLAGALTATSGAIGGFTITSTTHNVGGTTANSITLDSAAGIYMGGTSTAAPFRVTLAGAITATSGAIGGFTLGSTTLTAGSGASAIGLDTTQGIYLGSTTFSGAKFSVALDGTLSTTLTSTSVIQTAASGARVVINTAGVFGYTTDSAGNDKRTFAINDSDGSVSITGVFSGNVADSSIYGSTVLPGTNSITQGGTGFPSSQISQVGIDTSQITNSYMDIDSNNGGAILAHTSAAPTVANFTANGTWTCPASGVTTITVECWGAGAAGNNGFSQTAATGNSNGGSGGGGGEYTKFVIPVTASRVYNVTVGSPGLVGATNGALGANGTASTVVDSVSLATVASASGGKAATSNLVGGLGGSGTTVVNGVTATAQYNGGAGAPGVSNIITAGSGAGAAARTSSAGNPGSAGTSRASAPAGTATVGGGAGGAGQGTSGAGSAGAPVTYTSGSLNTLAGASSGGNYGAGGGGGAAVTVRGGAANFSTGGSGNSGYVRITYTSGNPVIAYSIAGAAGTDQYNNSYVAGVSGFVPVGAVMMYTKVLTQTFNVSGVMTASNAPSGWFACDGSAISRTTYAALFAIIGTAYGPGNGTTTFNLPGMGGSFPYGAPAGNTGGASTHYHTLSSTGQAQVAIQSTTVQVGRAAGAFTPAAAVNVSSAGTTAAQTQGAPLQGSTDATAGSGQYPPWVGFGFMIRYQ